MKLPAARPSQPLRRSRPSCGALHLICLVAQPYTIMSPLAKTGYLGSPPARGAAACLDDGRSTLPLRSNRILGNQGVRRKQQTFMFDGLADEQAIKRVPMERGQFMQVKHGPFMKRERRNPMSLPLVHHEALDRTGQRQLSQGMLHGEFPHGHHAEQHLVGRIREHLLRRGRQVFRPCDDP